MKKYIIVALITLSILSIAEILLRIQFGFCDALLYIHSEQYEYIAKPNQDRRRFGAHIHYNSFSQRSDEPDTTKTIILGLGDSVIFGGTWMDQDSLATTLFTKETGIQLLNISAGSWGPDNCAAYLMEKGLFNARAMILVCSSHDAYDVMSHIPVVGIYPNYPNKQYCLALIELIDRYLIPIIKKYFSDSLNKFDPDEEIVRDKLTSETVKKKSITFNPGFEKLRYLSELYNIPFIIYLHAEKSEILANKYNSMGQEIIEWANNNNIKIYEGLKLGEKTYMYKDKIHYNEKGQLFLNNIFNMIYKQCTEK